MTAREKALILTTVFFLRVWCRGPVAPVLNMKASLRDFAKLSLLDLIYGGSLMTSNIWFQSF